MLADPTQHQLFARYQRQCQQMEHQSAKEFILYNKSFIGFCSGLTGR
jgi:hypothetical protein